MIPNHVDLTVVFGRVERIVPLPVAIPVVDPHIRFAIPVRIDHETYRSARIVRHHYQIIQFATHGLIRGDIAGLGEAALVLTPVTSGDSFDDGLLTATEIANLNLHAKVVVLSACNTANFDSAKFASQVQGLTTAFAVSGVPTTVASLWPVESKTSERLMVQLYRHLLSDSNSVAVALSKSMADAIRDAPSRAFRHPRFWAPFIILGDGSVKVDRSPPQPKMDNIVSVSDNVSEILSAAPTDDGVITSEIGPMINGRSPSLIKRLNSSGAREWVIEDQKIGAGQIVRSSGNTYFASGYLWQQRSVPVLRGISGEGKVLWTRRVSTQFDSASFLAVAALPEGRVAALVSAFNPSDGDDQLEVFVIDLRGRELRKQTITVPKQKYQNLLGGRLLYSDGQLIVAVDYSYVSQGTRRNDFGMFEGCWSGGGTFIFSLNSGDLSMRIGKFVPDMAVYDMVQADDRIYFAGAKHRVCSISGEMAAFGAIDADLSVRPLWSAPDAFDSHLKALLPLGGELLGAIVTDRTVNIREYEPSANAAAMVSKVGPGKKHFDFQRDKYSEAAILKFSGSGTVEDVEPMDFGLPDDLHGLVKLGHSYAAYGDVGFNAWLAIAR